MSGSDGGSVKSDRKSTKSLSVRIPGPNFNSHRRNSSVTSTESSGYVRSREEGLELEEELSMGHGEGQPLDLSFHKRPSTPPTASDITQRFLFHCELKSEGLSYEDSQEDSDDSSDSQQPMDLGINPKAYKKSLMKRYRK